MSNEKKPSSNSSENEPCIVVTCTLRDCMVQACRWLRRSGLPQEDIDEGVDAAGLVIKKIEKVHGKIDIVGTLNYKVKAKPEGRFGS